MAQDTQWPSEDEDFDAVTSADRAGSLTNQNNQAEKLVPKPAKKPVNKVSVAVSEPDEHQSETAPEEIEEAFAKPVEPRGPVNDDESSQAEQASQEAPEATVADTEYHQSTEQIDSFPAVTKASKAPKNIKDLTRVALEVALIISLLGVGYYAYGLHNKNQDLSTQVATLRANPQIVIKQQTDELIAKVGSLISLPKGESPTVANVTDAAAAKKQSAFFSAAQNGDKVLLYPKAGIAILYRPSTNKIVLQAPLTFNADTTTKPATASTTPTTTKTIR